MRAETPGARTWLLAGVTLWALVSWALGLFGLGGRVDRLPPDPTLVQGLPAAVQPGDDRLGPLPQYAELGDRPMFTMDRRPQPFFINPQGEEAPAEFEYVLTSVLLTPALEVAIVQPVAGGESLRLKVGESAAGAPGWQLASLTPRSAVFDGPEGQRTLELRVFDGVGGEAPTAMATPSAPADAPPRGRATMASGDGERGDAGNRPVVVTTSSSPAPTDVEVPPPGQQPQPADATAEASPEDQVNAIRQRIEARRARQREQAQQDAQGQ